MKTFSSDFFKLYQKFSKHQNFAFSRFSDGEMFVMQNIPLILDKNLTQVGETIHGCHYPEHDFKKFDPNIEEHQNFRLKLIESYKHKAENYYVGLSCPCCVGEEANSWMKELRDDESEFTTWSNLFVNANYPLFIEYFVPYIKNREIIVVANEKFNSTKSELKVLRHFPIGYNAMINNLSLIDDISNYIEKHKIQDKLFLFSASSLSNILIYELFKKYPNNTYMDIGTTLHKQLGLEIARDYLKAYWTNQFHSDLHKICIW